MTSNPPSKLTIKKKTTLNDTVKALALTAKSGGKTYYFMPVWFTDNGTYDLQVLKQGELPEEIKNGLKDILNDKKEGDERLQEVSNTVQPEQQQEAAADSLDNDAQ